MTTGTMTPDQHADAVAILLGNMTPREIDERLAELHTTARRLLAARESNVDAIHRYAGSVERIHGRKSYTMTTTEARAELVRRVVVLQRHHAETGSYEAFPPGLAPWDLRGAERAMSSLDELDAEYAANREAMRPYDAEYARRPWSRFFLVTSSDGHVHSSTYCSTCRPTTTYGWLPQLSGRTEADAVAELGPALCSVCFTSAPVRYQGGKITKARAVKMAAEAARGGKPEPAPRPYLYSDESLRRFNRKGLNDVAKRLQLEVPPRLPAPALIDAIKARQDELRAEWAGASA